MSVCSSRTSAAEIDANSDGATEGGIVESTLTAAYVVRGMEFAAIRLVSCPSGSPIPDRSIAASTEV